MKKNTSSEFHTPLERSGRALSESVDEKIWHRGLLEKMAKNAFFWHKAIFEVRITPLCDYTFTVGPDLM